MDRTGTATSGGSSSLEAEKQPRGFLCFRRKQKRQLDEMEGEHRIAFGKLGGKIDDLSRKRCEALYADPRTRVEVDEHASLVAAKACGAPQGDVPPDAVSTRQIDERCVYRG